MIPAERQQILRNILESRGMVSIAEMAERLGVSQMTVRRDIQTLEQEGCARVVSGGARRVGRITVEPPQAEKMLLQAAEKRGIAKKAVMLITPGSAVYLDAGTTCLAIAQEITNRPDLRDSIVAVTNDFTVAHHFMLHAKCSLYHTGGEVLRSNMSCVGETTANQISRLNIDLAFLSASSWDAEWISTPTESKIPVKIAAAKASRRSFLVCDSTKYGKVGFFNIIRLQEIEGVITDTGLSNEARSRLARQDFRLILADPDPLPE